MAVLGYSETGDGGPSYHLERGGSTSGAVLIWRGGMTWMALLSEATKLVARALAEGRRGPVMWAWLDGKLEEDRG
jgi:hypothetical protein